MSTAPKPESTEIGNDNHGSIAGFQPIVLKLNTCAVDMNVHPTVNIVLWFVITNPLPGI